MQTDNRLRQLTYDQVQELLVKSRDREFIIQVSVVMMIVDDYIKKYNFAKDDFVFTQYKAGYIMVTKIKNIEGRNSLNTPH